MGTKRSKRWRQDSKDLPPQPVSVEEAVKRVLAFDKGKFDQTVELVCNLGIDPKQADQALRGSVSLPHGIGATKKVIVFCEGADAEKAIAAGALEAGLDDLIKKVLGGWTDFDVAIATPPTMRNVSKLGRVLGPQGKMPSPKSGTVTADVVTAVKEYAAGKLEYRNDAGGNVAVPVGKMSFPPEKLVENVKSFLDHVRRRKPATSKGTYMKKVFLTATMTPSVPVEPPV
jgi:large subunit ribosomal protein L1